jgi:hypothetical protein
VGEILAAVQKNGYKFATAKPVNSVNGPRFHRYTPVYCSIPAKGSVLFSAAPFFAPASKDCFEKGFNKIPRRLSTSGQKAIKKAQRVLALSQISPTKAIYQNNC